MVVWGGAHFFTGDGETPLNVLLGVGAAAAEAPLQLFPGRRGYKDEDGIGYRFLHGDSAPHLNLQDYVSAFGTKLLDLFARSPVIVAVVGYVLQEVTGGDAALKLFGSEEEVVDSVPFSSARLSSRRRDASREVGLRVLLLLQAGNNGALADAARARHDEEPALAAKESCEWIV